VPVNVPHSDDNGVTVLANSIPPFPGPIDVLSITKTHLISVSGS